MSLKKKAPRMNWYGLTGSIGSGKSATSEILRSKGIAVVDSDELARYVVRPGEKVLTEIAQTFGQDVLDKSGALDRKKMAEIIFNDPPKRVALENLLHPLIRKEADRRRKELEALGQKIAFNDVPLLFEKKMESLFDKVVLVTCSEEDQLNRVMKRNGLTSEEAKKRIATQIPLFEKEKRADFVIRNDGTLSDLERKVTQFLSEIQVP